MLGRESGLDMVPAPGDSPDAETHRPVNALREGYACRVPRGRQDTHLI